MHRLTLCRATLLAAAACGDPPDTSATATTTTTTTTTGATATSGPDSSGSAGVSEGSSTGPPTTGASTGTSEGPTSSTSGGPTSSTSSGPGSSSGSSSGGFVCDPNAVPDVLQFNYVRTVDIGSRIQASFYNIDAQEMVFLTYEGKGKRVALDGTILGDVTAPPEVSQVLDGATYDQVKGIGLLVDQECDLAEVDAASLAFLTNNNIGAKFGLDICSGLAIGLDGHLYITSTNTEEVVVVTRDLQTEVRRFKVDDDGLTNVDGISLIAGSENFLVLSTYDLKSAIFTPTGEVVVPASTIGGPAPPLVGGDMPEIPDAVLTVCGNGHAWICEGLEKVGCYEYAPEGGDSDSCPCTIPG